MDSNVIYGDNGIYEPVARNAAAELASLHPGYDFPTRGDVIYADNVIYGAKRHL